MYLTNRPWKNAQLQMYAEVASSRFKLQRRCYTGPDNGSKLHLTNKNNNINLSFSLATIFNSNVSGSIAVKEFKTVVNQLASSKPPSTSPDKKEINILRKLMLAVLGPGYKVKHNLTSVSELGQRLKTSIHRGTINNKTILKRIKQFKETQPINVNIPSSKNVEVSRMGSSPREMLVEPSLPFLLNNKDSNSGNNKTDILEILDKLEAHLLNNKTNTNDLYQIFSNILEESKPENLINKHIKVSGSPMEEINLTSLTEYLSKMERQESEKQAVLKQQERVYNWKESFTSKTPSNNKVIIENIISLLNPLSWIYKPNSFPIKYLLDAKDKVPVTSKYYMILDLKTDTKQTYNAKTARLPINIKSRDIFEIINNSQLSPELTLSRIKSLQDYDWKLVGTLFTDNNKIIFMKETTVYKKSQIYYIKWGTMILLFMSIGYHSFTFLKEDPKKGPEINPDIHSRK